MPKLVIDYPETVELDGQRVNVRQGLLDAAWDSYGNEFDPRPDPTTDPTEEEKEMVMRAAIVDFAIQVYKSYQIKIAKRKAQREAQTAAHALESIVKSQITVSGNDDSLV